MDILLTGATGYIGSAVLTSLLDAGHAVTAIVRSADAAASVTSQGATAIVGDVTDVDWFTSQLRAVDAAIHAAAPAEGAEQFDRAVATAVVAAFGGTTKPYIHTGGIWAYGNNDSITEQSPRNAPALVAWRAAVEALLLESDVSATVLEPAVVYGRGGGLVTVIADGPRTESGALTLIGDGTQHWSSVHVDDVAALYRLVIELGSGFGYLIAANGENPTVREIGLAVAGDGGVVASTARQARMRLGEAFADALLLDQQPTGARARELGWTPTRPSLLEELQARV